MGYESRNRSRQSVSWTTRMRSCRALPIDRSSRASVLPPARRAARRRRTGRLALSSFWGRSMSAACCSVKWVYPTGSRTLSASGPVRFAGDHPPAGGAARGRSEAECRAGSGLCPHRDRGRATRLPRSLIPPDVELSARGSLRNADVGQPEDWGIEVEPGGGEVQLEPFRLTGVERDEADVARDLQRARD